jgi:tetratricopeptide (TPR) repeat protein
MTTTRTAPWVPPIWVLVFALAAAAQQPAELSLRLLSVRTEAEATSLRARAQAGESFKDLATRHSIDPSGPAGGYLGRIVPADLSKEFQGALAGLREGEVSRAIKLVDVYVLLYVIPEAERHYIRANELLAQGRGEEAVTALQAAVRLKPNDAALHSGLAAILSQQGKAAEAVAAFREAIRLNPNAAAPHYNLAVTLLGQGKREEAVAEYREAVRIAPNEVETRYNLDGTGQNMCNSAQEITIFAGKDALTGAMRTQHPIRLAGAGNGYAQTADHLMHGQQLGAAKARLGLQIFDENDGSHRHSFSFRGGTDQ